MKTLKKLSLTSYLVNNQVYVNTDPNTLVPANNTYYYEKPTHFLTIYGKEYYLPAVKVKIPVEEQSFHLEVQQ